MIPFSRRLDPRLVVLALLFVLVAVILLAQGPIPQDPAYHLFADRRICLGVANFADVTSNLGFAVVGLVGVWFVLRATSSEIFPISADRWPYLVFFIGLMLVAMGSAYYHLAPNNNRLLWDRLPMTVAFMALTGAFVIDRIDRDTGLRLVLPILVGLGIASTVYWHWTETRGMGDLRPYLLVQFGPMLALPLICWLYPKGPLTHGRYLFWMLLLLYGAARLPELFDPEVFAQLGQTLSGHTLKHLLSALAGLVVMRMLAVARAESPQSP